MLRHGFPVLRCRDRSLLEVLPFELPGIFKAPISTACFAIRAAERQRTPRAARKLRCLRLLCSESTRKTSKNFSPALCCSEPCADGTTAISLISELSSGLLLFRCSVLSHAYSNHGCRSPVWLTKGYCSMLILCCFIVLCICFS